MARGTIRRIGGYIAEDRRLALSAVAILVLVYGIMLP